MTFVRPQLPWQVREESGMAVREGQLGVPRGPLGGRKAEASPLRLWEKAPVAQVPSCSRGLELVRHMPCWWELLSDRH